MRFVKLSAASEPPPPRGLLAHDVRDPSQPTTVLGRKGTFLSHTQLGELLERGVQEMHVLVLEEGDLIEDEAATLLARTIAGPGVAPGQTHYGQSMLTSTIRGFFHIKPDAADAINDQPGVLLFTGEADCPVDTGATLGGVKCAPLILGADAIAAVQRIVERDGPVLEVVPFQPTRVAFVAPTTRVRGNAYAQARASLSKSLEWYASSLEPIDVRGDSAADIGRAFRAAADEHVGLIMAAGASATDPCDLLFEGLRHAGGEVDQIGMPAEPGTACWIGHLRDLPVLGLASCELFGKPGALDLLLPRILSGQPLDRRLLRRLGRGGLVLGGPSRLAPYHTAEP